MATGTQAASETTTGWLSLLLELAPVWAPVLALAGVLINLLLTWWLGRYKTHSEKTWEKRREVYTELLKRLRVVKQFADMRKAHGDPTFMLAAPDEAYADSFMGRFMEAYAQVRLHADENTLYTSKKMERILDRLWKKFEETEDRYKTGGGVREFEFEDARLFAVEAAFNEVLARARNEIRVTS